MCVRVVGWVGGGHPDRKGDGTMNASQCCYKSSVHFNPVWQAGPQYNVGDASSQVGRPTRSVLIILYVLNGMCEFEIRRC